MPVFVELYRDDADNEGKVSINPAKVIVCRPDEEDSNRCIIEFDNGKTMGIAQPYAEVSQKLNYK